MSVGWFTSFVVSVRVAVWRPAAVGVKSTFKVCWVPALMLSAVLGLVLNGGLGVTAGVTLRVVGPVLAIVTGRVPVEPTFTLPKLVLAMVTLIVGLAPVPVKV